MKLFLHFFISDLGVLVKIVVKILVPIVAFNIVVGIVDVNIVVGIFVINTVIGVFVVNIVVGVFFVIIVVGIFVGYPYIFSLSSPYNSSYDNGVRLIYSLITLTINKSLWILE